MIPDYESITSKWSPTAESFYFWRLVGMNKLTLESAQKDILMTEQTLRWLIKLCPLERIVIEAIYKQRIETWKAFRYLCAHPEAAPEFQRAALSQGGG